jgi:hypothetical protein
MQPWIIRGKSRNAMFVSKIELPVSAGYMVTQEGFSWLARNAGKK